MHKCLYVPPVPGVHILGWFKNQRSAVGRLLKKKSGEGAKTLTTRSKWQISAFKFLDAYIKPRIYQHDTGLPGDTEGGQSEQDDTVETIYSTSADTPTGGAEGGPSTARSSAPAKRHKSYASRVDEALVALLDSANRRESGDSSQSTVRKFPVISCN